MSRKLITSAALLVAGYYLIGFFIFIVLAVLTPPDIILRLAILTALQATLFGALTAYTIPRFVVVPDQQPVSLVWRCAIGAALLSLCATPLFCALLFYGYTNPAETYTVIALFVGISLIALTRIWWTKSN